MKHGLAVLRVGLLIAAHGVVSGTLHAQPQITPAMAASMPCLPVESRPTLGTFWTFDKNGKITAPLPKNPFPAEVRVISLGGGQFLIDAAEAQFTVRALEGERMGHGGFLAIKEPFVHAPEMG